MSDLGQTERSASAFYTEQMAKLAEVGARLCGYSGADPKQWATGPCDCKSLPPGHSIIPQRYAGSEWTGCCEIRTAYLALATLQRAGDETAEDERRGRRL